MSDAVRAQTDSAADYSVKVTVRNGRLLTRIRAAGFESVSAFCRANGLSLPQVRGLVGLRRTGMKKLAPEWRSIVIQVSDVLKCMPQDIIPPQHWHAELSKNSFEVDMTAREAAALVGRGSTPQDNLIRDEVEQVLRSRIEMLPARLQRVVRLRHGITKTARGRGRECTLEEVALLMNVSRERIRQMERRAYEIMRPRNHSEQNL